VYLKIGHTISGIFSEIILKTLDKSPQGIWIVLVRAREDIGTNCASGITGRGTAFRLGSPHNNRLSGFYKTSSLAALRLTVKDVLIR